MDHCNSNAIAMDLDSASSLPPGFRFQPNDEELFHYLNHKVSGKSLDVELIAVVDVYNSEPWDLPSKSRLKTRGEQDWYFFSARGRKYGGSWRIKRTTEKGYWKSTGQDRKVRHNSRSVGMMRKSLVFHTGRAPKGLSTNWVMHEYRLVDNDDKVLEKAGIAVDALVLCKISHKIGKKPKNGGQASIGEEGGEHEDVEVEEAAAEEVLAGDDGGSVEAKDLDQNNYIEHSGNLIGDSQQLIIGTGETSELRHDQMFPEQQGMGPNPFKDGYSAEDVFSTPNEVDPADYEMADNFLNLDEGFYPSEILVDENTDSHQTPVTKKNDIGEADKVSKESLHLSKLQGSNDASSSKQNPKAVMDESGVTFSGNFSELEEILMRELETQ